MIKFILCLFIPIWILNAENINIIIYGDENYPPYSYVENGVLKGIYTDIIKKAAKEIDGYDIELRPIPWRRGLTLIESGGAFALYPPYYRPFERPWMDYSIPILEENIVILGSKFIPQNDDTWLQQLKTLKIGKNNGFSMFAALTKYLDVDSLNIEEANGTEENLLKLGSGRIDVYINDKISMLWTLEELKRKGIYKNYYLDLEIWHTVSKEFGHIGYSKTNVQALDYEDDFKKKMDEALTKLEKKGTIEDILNLYTGK